VIVSQLPEHRETKELEWYIHDHFVRQSNKGITQFKSELLAHDLITLYLRYRNYTLEKINEMINPVLKNLILRQVIIYKANNNNVNSPNNNSKSFELTSPLSRLQCLTCFSLLYLGTAEPKNCLRCSSSKLHIFPTTKRKQKMDT